MAENDPHDTPGREHEVSRLYRQLPHEEPPARVDDAIRAEARRLGAMHAAPLVPPTGRRSWHYPFAAAAVIVLAVAVTWHVEREQPDMVATAPASPVQMKDQAEAKKELPPVAPPAATVPSVRAPARSEAPRRDRAAEPRGPAPADATTAAKPAERQFTPDPAPPAAKAEAARPAAPPEARESTGAGSDSAVLMKQQRAVQGPQAQRRADAAAEGGLAASAESPERALERIVQLRREGKHDEADKALAEFRKRHPDFRISPETLEKVERR